MADIVMNLGEVQCVSSNGSSSFPYTAIVVVVLTLVTSFTLLIMAVIGAAYWRKKHPPLINSLKYNYISYPCKMCPLITGSLS